MRTIITSSPRVGLLLPHALFFKLLYVLGTRNTSINSSLEWAYFPPIPSIFIKIKIMTTAVG